MLAFILMSPTQHVISSIEIKFVTYIGPMVPTKFVVTSTEIVVTSYVVSLVVLRLILSLAVFISVGPRLDNFTRHRSQC